MRELREQGWLATMPLGCVAVDREAGEFFLRSRSFTFPGLKIAEIFGIDDGPLFEEIRRNILHVNGADHSRLRGLVNPAFTPRAIERWRAADARVPGSSSSTRSKAPRAATRWRRSPSPTPRRVIATIMGAPLEDAGAPVGLVALDPAPVRDEGRSRSASRSSAAVVEFYAFAGELLERRRHDPGEDLISTLIAAER